MFCKIVRTWKRKIYWLCHWCRPGTCLIWSCIANWDYKCVKERGWYIWSKFWWFMYHFVFWLQLHYNSFIFYRWWRRSVNDMFLKVEDFPQLFQELKNRLLRVLPLYKNDTWPVRLALLEKTKPYLLKRSSRRLFPSKFRLAVTLG